jgi:hypothetical protein
VNARWSPRPARFTSSPASASLGIIGKSLKHKSTQTTAIHARLSLDPVRQSVNTATSAMLRAAGLKKPEEVVKLKKTA